MLPDPSQDILRKITNAIGRIDRRLKNLEALPLPRTVIEISTTTLSAAQATISFTSIPDKYTHLELVGLLRTDRAATSDELEIIFNADTTAKYNWVYWIARHDAGTGAPVTASDDAALDDHIEAGHVCGDSAPASTYAPVQILIPGYAQAVYKSCMGSVGHIRSDAVDNIWLGQFNGKYNSTDKITSVTVSPGAGTNFMSGSILTLYGRG